MHFTKKIKPLEENHFYGQKLILHINHRPYK